MKENVLSSSYLDSCWGRIYGLQEEKDGKTEIQKSEYLENKKSFLDKIKKKFHSFWRAVIWWKKKKKKDKK